MRVIIVFGLVIASAMAAPNQAELLQYTHEQSPDSYNFLFQTSDGTFRSESGQLRDAGTEKESLVVSGNFQYVAPDGITYTVTYTADDNGFHPVGDHLPKFP